MRRLFTVAVVSLLSVVLVSCASVQTPGPASAELAAIPQQDLPKVVTVLPFQNETAETGIANQVRKTFYNHFSSKPYQDVELSLVDKKIVRLEKSSGKNILDLKPQEISQSMDCDGLIYGKVTDYVKVYAAVYSQLGVEAEVWMVDAKTGQEILRLKDSVRYHQGGVPMSPLGALMTVISTAMNIREIQQIRMVNELCYKLCEKIPSPVGIAVEDRPVIKEVLTNLREGPFTKGKVIRVGLEGDQGLVATFDIGNFKKGIPMEETKPGIYMGEYPVMPGDNTSDMPLIAYLKKPAGYESQWIDAAGLVNIDTTPPPQVKGFRAKGFHDRIELSWDMLKNVPDLSGYIILRSEQPLSAYVEVARVELNTFEDRAAKPETTYYYRVVALDQVGNQSELPDPVRASLISKEPVTLGGELQKDTILSGVYAIKGQLIVPKGLSFTVEPDSRLIFAEKAALIVYGRLVTNGKELPVEFFPSCGDRKWNGISVEGGRAVMDNFRIKGALVALRLKNTEGQIDGGVITDNEVGVSISGTPSVTVKNSRISRNRTGIELEKTDAEILQNNIFQNKEGILIRGFSGGIRDNNIFDNCRNIDSESTVKIGANYLGSINIDEMGINGVSVTKTYHNRLPDGEIVDAVSNPYAVLTPEDRRKKATELVIEAGHYFRQRNYGRSSALFEEALKAFSTAETYYYLALCHQEMKEEGKALKYLQKGVEKFPTDPSLQKALGLMYYQKGNEPEARKIFKEVIRLNPGDRQVKFLLERTGN